MFRVVVKLALIFCLIFSLEAQDRYWIPKSAQHQLDKYQLSPFFCSQWLNSCSYELSKNQIIQFKDLGIKVDPVRAFELKSIKNPAGNLLGFALEQVRANALIDEGLTGKNIKIGVIDGGFLNADSFPSLTNLFQDNKIMAYRDFITPQMGHYEGSAFLDDIHGTEVLQLIGGVDQDKSIQFGLATESMYYLARTDHGGYERRQEEDLLIKALEWMEKMDIRLINISLGYAKGYNDPAENYTPKDMDGKTSMVARAIDTAFYKKNMLVIVAAGNEGSDPDWRVLSTPGDARGAFTVGATKLKLMEKLPYSSIGTESLDYLKPNVSCFSTQGTSFSTPIITGIAAAMMQFDSTLSAPEIREIIERSGNLYPYGNNYVGYGVPDCRKILDQLKEKEIEEKKARIVSGKKIKIDPKDQSYLVVYHKKGVRVIHKETYRPEGKRVKISKFKGAEQSTVFLENKSLEIIWR